MSDTATLPEPQHRFFRDSRIVRACTFAFRKTGFDKFASRFAVVFIALLAFWNPTRWCYVHWVMPDGAGPARLWIGGHLAEIFVGILFVTGAVYLVRTTQKALGHIGMLLVGAGLLTAFGLLAWNTDIAWTSTLLVIALQIGLAALAAIAFLSANWNRRISGQITTTVAGPVQADVGGHHHG